MVQQHVPVTVVQYPPVVPTLVCVVWHLVGRVGVVVPQGRVDGGVGEGVPELVSHIANQHVDFVLVQICVVHMRYTVPGKEV